MARAAHQPLSEIMRWPLPYLDRFASEIAEQNREAESAMKMESDIGG